MAALSPQQVTAAEEFAAATIGALRTERGVHAETAVAGAARMAGTFLIRSFGFPLGGIEPGQVVLSGKANEEGPRLVSILGGVLARVGIDLDARKLEDDPGPDRKPLLGFLETQRRLEPLYARIRERVARSRRRRSPQRLRPHC
jgi:hypothetical protein